MVTIRLLIGAGLCATLWLCSCGESQAPAAPYSRILGNSSVGAPLGHDVPDPGILQDPASYQPTKGPGLAGKKGGKAAAGDAESQIRAEVHGLMSAIKDGDVELALRSYNAEQVKALSPEKYDALFPTFSKLDLLKTALEKKLDKTKVEQLLAPFRGPSGDPKVDKLDDEHATITPNLALLLFGPVKMTPTMAIAKTPDGWKFQLDSPLSAADVDAIIAFHKKLQDVLDKVIEWLDKQETVDPNQLQTIVAQAAAGQPVELEGEKKPEIQGDQPSAPPSGPPGRRGLPPGRGGGG